LTRRAAAESVRLHVVHGEARTYLVSAIADADTLQRANPAYVNELARWTGQRTDAKDGVPTTSVPPTRSYGDLSVRQFATLNLHRPVASEQDGAGTLLVLGTDADADDRLARLHAGEATSAVLLAATRMGLATCPLSQPLEIPATRTVVRNAILHAEFVPQMVLRIGWPSEHPNPFPPTRRRPASEVTEYLT
jgi:nitroreductase